MSVKSWLAGHRGQVRAAVLLLSLAGAAGALAVWKMGDLAAADAAYAAQPEPYETVTVAVATERSHRPVTVAIGTILALKSVTLRNEVAGTVRQVALTPGRVVEPGALLVALDVSVEVAELRALEAEAALAEATLERYQRASQTKAVSDVEVDRARAGRDVAVAQIGRIKAVIGRKTIRAPFRARVGIADVHPGQYLESGSVLTTLQGVDEAAHVEFAVAQSVAAGLGEGQVVLVRAQGHAGPIEARIVAVDARVDPATRNARVRARIVSAAPAPGASVRVEVPTGPESSAVAVPVSALRKGPSGDHVFVIVADPNGAERASLRPVESGTVLGDDVVIVRGLAAGERVASSGSFKLREAALVSIITAPAGLSVNR